jgi:acyl carrier protein
MISDPIRAQAPAPDAVLEIVQGLAQELQPQRRAHAVSLDSSLERDLGFDSLGRVELLARLERSFGVRLPEGLLGTAETPRDLLPGTSPTTPSSSCG